MGTQQWVLCSSRCPGRDTCPRWTWFPLFFRLPCARARIASPRKETRARNPPEKKTKKKKKRRRRGGATAAGAPRGVSREGRARVLRPRPLPAFPPFRVSFPWPLCPLARGAAGAPAALVVQRISRRCNGGSVASSRALLYRCDEISHVSQRMITYPLCRLSRCEYIRRNGRCARSTSVSRAATDVDEISATMTIAERSLGRGRKLRRDVHPREFESDFCEPDDLGNSSMDNLSTILSSLCRCLLACLRAAARVP
jgi:hypothetical protein